MNYWRLPSQFLVYLAENAKNNHNDEHLPAMKTLSAELGVSLPRLREQLEVAKTLGLVDVRPRTGIRRLPYRFLPAVWQSLSYAIKVDPKNFQAFADMRQHLETSYWRQAVVLLTEEDHQALRALMEQAWEKLRGTPIRIPHEEHRQLHLSIYKRLDNPFVLGILEAYWEAYEASGYNVYADYDYLQTVWTYHQKMVDAICSGNLDDGYQALVAHTDLLYHRPAGSEG